MIYETQPDTYQPIGPKCSRCGHGMIYCVEELLDHGLMLFWHYRCPICAARVYGPEMQRN